MIKQTATLLALALTATLAACDGTIPPPDTAVDETSQAPVEPAPVEPVPTTEEGPAQSNETMTGSVEPDPAEEATDPELNPIATGAAVAQSPTFSDIAGRWAATSGDCASGGVYEISASRVERPGRLCNVAELIEAGDDSVTAALLCPTGGESTEERELLRLSLTDETLTMNIVGSEDPPTTLQRCDQ